MILHNPFLKRKRALKTDCFLKNGMNILWFQKIFVLLSSKFNNDSSMVMNNEGLADIARLQPRHKCQGVPSALFCWESLR